VSISAGTVLFTPSPNYTGEASFVYTIQDDGTTSGVPDFKVASATARFFVAPVNDPPSANPQTLVLNKDTSILITLAGDDGDPEIAQTLTFAIVGEPAHGVLSAFDPVTGQLVYTPVANYIGSDSLQFIVTDDDSAGPPASLTSPPAAVSINIVPATDTPSVTPTVTREGRQTTSGLVITPNPDDHITTHFQVNNILNGLLFQNDGTTPIADGALITLAQGAAGLRFTPTPGKYSPAATFSFEVRGASSALGRDLRDSGGGLILVLPNEDFGDAEAYYPTLLSDDGARHVVLSTGSTLYLGATPPDAETDGHPSSSADGDNKTGTNDEDGVTLPSSIFPN